MKFLNILVSLLLLGTFALPSVYAVSPTQTPAPSVNKDEKLIDEINNLREKVASKVAELNLVEKRGIFLVVTEVSGNKITGNDVEDNTRIIDVDELTKFSSDDKSSFGISDITKGSKLSIIGLYNKQSKRLLARFVNTVSLPLFISGQISDIDRVNYTITVVSEDKTKMLIDIENLTKSYVYTKEDGTSKYGFSKLKVGDRVYVVGYPDKTEKNRMTASRILDFTELPKNPKISVTQESSSDSFEKTSITPSAKPTATK